MIPFCILAIEDEQDREYMAALYIEYQRLMYSTIKKIDPDSWFVEDVMQSTVEKLIDKLQKLRTFDKEHLVNYIISACKNTAINEIRRRKRSSVWTFEEGWDSFEQAAAETDVEEQLIRKESVERLHQAWPKMDPRDRYLLEAHYYLEKSAAEIAADLDMKPENVRMALSRARKRVGKLLTNQE